MPMEFVVRDNDRQQIREFRAFKGDVLPVSFDFSPWSDDNGAITSATWTIIDGNATLASKTLASNVASAILTTAESGWSLIEVKGTGANHTKVVKLRVLAKDPASFTTDYWSHYL